MQLFETEAGGQGLLLYQRGSAMNTQDIPAKNAVIVINVNRLDFDDQSQSADLFLAITKMLFPACVQW
jgi:hypothetical protein